MKNRTAHKRLLERRRRTIRVQRGSGNGVTSVEQWINAVKATKPFVNKSGYVLGDLMDSELTLPSQTEYMYEFDINKGAPENPESKVDIRQEGATIRNFLKDSLARLPSVSPKEFQEYITSVRRSEIGDADDIVKSLVFMVRIENKMRVLANAPPLEETADGLADEKMYPLFLWALILNTPEAVEPGFSTMLEPSPPTEQAP